MNQTSTHTEDEGIDVIYSSSVYDTRKLNQTKTSTHKYPEDEGIDVLYGTQHHSSKNLKKTSREKIDDYKYPVVHSINKDGITCWFSNDNTKGHFGVPKVILNFNQKQYSYPEQNDWEGKYGMSQISFGIPISSKEEGDMILKAIDTDAFKTIIKATKWGAFQTDYRMFKYFKKDFWKEISFKII